MFREILHSADRYIESGGGWYILALDGMLLIPVVFSVFFFPVGILIGVCVAAALTIGTLLVIRRVHAHHHRRGIM